MIATDVVKETLERSLETLHQFDCPPHHREQYERAEATLAYLTQPGIVERVVLVDRPTFAPLCADLVPDSGVCFLRCAAHGPKDLASALEQGALTGSGLFLQLWEDALGLEYPAWRAVADRAPAIFVRLGESVCTAGRWHWAPLNGPHQSISYLDMTAAFDALIEQAERSGDTQRALQLRQWQYGVLN